jgi:hypothetical protein
MCFRVSIFHSQNITQHIHTYIYMWYTLAISGL